MSTTYKNAALAAVGTSLGDVYTVPTSTTAIVRAIHIANLDDSADQTVTVQWTDHSNSDAARALIVGAVVPQKSAFQLLDGVLILEAGDKIQASAGTASKLDITVSLMETA